MQDIRIDHVLGASSSCHCKEVQNLNIDAKDNSLLKPEVNQKNSIDNQESIGVRSPVKSNFSEETQACKITQSFYCSICEINCGSDINYQNHCLGKRHIKRADLITNENFGLSDHLRDIFCIFSLIIYLATLETRTETIAVSKQFFCEICQIECNSKTTLDAHFKSQKHAKKVANKPIASNIQDFEFLPEIQSRNTDNYYDDNEVNKILKLS
ncbi:hypothetical protein HZS_2045 [Henneguya salminicola]|nr:hypothetical protein HZS_2045 [Henneguya salminicola]